MPSFILLDARLFTGGADLSGHSNKIEITTELEEKDATNYRSNGWKEVLGGLASAEIAAEGQWEAGDPGKVDNASWADLGQVRPWTACPTDASVGARAYFTRALRANYKLGDQVGEVAPWSASAKSAWPLVRGVVEHSPGTPVSASGTSTGVQLGPIEAGRRLYAALHVLSVSGTAGPSLAVSIESDDSADFLSPVGRYGFDAIGSPGGGEILRGDGGAITDSWWRVTWSVSGTAPSFLFVVALGIR